ncbi:MAG: hypothetical protein ACXVKJ_20180, partial [Ilumatobacteraceae bacterium]
LTSTWANLPADRKDPVSRDEVMKLWSRAELLRLTNIRANQNRKMGDPGPEGSSPRWPMQISTRTSTPR